VTSRPLVHYISRKPDFEKIAGFTAVTIGTQCNWRRGWDCWDHPGARPFGPDAARRPKSLRAILSNPVVHGSWVRTPPRFVRGISGSDRRASERNVTGGEGGIRTHGAREGTPVFKTGAINRSATSPLLDSIAYKIFFAPHTRVSRKSYQISPDTSPLPPGVGAL
jgi:hypothetical protein